MKNRERAAPSSRKDKIKMLLDINAGKPTIDEAVPGPKKCRIWNLKDGLYVTSGGVKMSEEEFKKRPASGLIDILVIRAKKDRD